MYLATELTQFARQRAAVGDAAFSTPSERSKPRIRLLVFSFQEFGVFV